MARALLRWRAMKLAIACLPSLLLAGCFDEWLTTTVTFSDEASATIELEMDISGECSGSGMRQDDAGITHWTKTMVGDAETGSCQIDVTWDGDLISLAKMRADTVEECGVDNDKCNADELDLSLAITLDAAFFDAGAEHFERAQLVSMNARATTGGAVLFEMDKTTGLPLELGPDPGVKAQLKTAYLASGSLLVNASGRVELPMSEVRRLQAGSPIGVLTVSLSSKLGGSIEAHY
jgi:hypothetical protein